MRSFEHVPVKAKVDWRVQLLKRMKQEDVQPNSDTFLIVFAVRSPAGLLGKGQAYFQSMTTEHGISTTIDHYACKISLAEQAIWTRQSRWGTTRLSDLMRLFGKLCVVLVQSTSKLGLHSRPLSLRDSEHPDGDHVYTLLEDLFLKVVENRFAQMSLYADSCLPEKPHSKTGIRTKLSQASPLVQKWLAIPEVEYNSLVGCCLEERPAESCFDGLTIHAYWIPVEGYRDMWNGVVVTLDGPKTRSLVDENGLKIADVSEVTYHKCKEEGACYLQQVDHLGLGLLVAYLRGVNVFRVLDRTTVPFGIGAWNNRLEPFISVATSDFSAGTKLQVKELAGVRLPNGDLHNGCVRVDDVSSDSCSIRFFVGFYDYYSILHYVLSGRIHAEVSTGCEILKYIPRRAD